MITHPPRSFRGTVVHLLRRAAGAMAACACLSGPVAAELAVRAIDPPHPASGQVVLLVADALPAGEGSAGTPDVRVLVEQDGVAAEAFVFRSAALPGAVYARLPAGLRAGRALVAFALGTAVVGEPMAFDVAPRAAAPTLWGVHPYGDPAAAAVHPGTRVVLVGTGMDTTGVTAILRHADGTDRLVPTFAHSSPAVGVAAVLDLPADLPPGPMRVSARVRVCEPIDGCQSASLSRESEPIELSLE
jgi:hypothetical protein